MKNKNNKVIFCRGWTDTENEECRFSKDGWLNFAVILDYTETTWRNGEDYHRAHEAWCVNNDYLGDREFDLRGLLKHSRFLPAGKNRNDLIKIVNGMVESPEFLDLAKFKKTFFSDVVHGKITKLNKSPDGKTAIWFDSFIHRHRRGITRDAQFGRYQEQLDIRGIDSEGFLHINDWETRPKMHLGVLRFSLPKKYHARFPLLEACKPISLAA